jgi:hypothetical protein
LAPGRIVIAGATAISGFFPTNADGGRIGVSSILPIIALTGAYFMCSAGILGKYAKHLDISLDDVFLTRVLQGLLLRLLSW